MPETETPADARAVMANSIGPTIGYHISRCERGGGYIVWVDGSVYAACSTLAEAIATMGRVAADQYQEPAALNGGAPPMLPASSDPIPQGIRPVHRPVPDAPAYTTGTGQQLGSAAPPPNFAERVSATMGLVLMALVVGARAAVGA